MDASHPGLPDENTPTLPETWRRILHTRRGGTGAGEAALDGSAVERLSARIRAGGVALKRSLAHPQTDPAYAEGARRYLDGEPDPVGAAAVAAALEATRRDQEHGGAHDGLADAWAAAHGPPFAAHAFVELAGINDRWSRAGGRTGGRLRPAADKDHLTLWWVARGGVRRMRALLAAAGDSEHEEVTGRLAELRTSPLRRIVASYLVPSRRDWLEECAAAPPATDRDRSALWMLLCSLESPGELERLGFLTDPNPYQYEPDILATIADGAGPEAVARVVAAILATRWVRSDQRAKFFGALAVLPTDEAFLMLLDLIEEKEARRELLAAAGRFPVRALRLLAPAAAGRSTAADLAAVLLRGTVTGDPGLVTAAMPGLPEPARTVVDGLVRACARAPDAPDAELPRVLTDPPWAGTRKDPKPVVVGGLQAPAVRSALWEPGERERWSAETYPLGFTFENERLDWNREVRLFKTGKYDHLRRPGLLIQGPEELVRPLFDGWTPRDLLWSEDWIRPLVARYDLAALPLAVDVARANPATAGDALVPFLSPEVAALMADWWVRLRSARRHAAAWFARHGLDAARPLIPAALAKPGRERRQAEAALRQIAATAGAGAIAAEARAHGDAAADAVAAMLAVDPLDVVPAKIPKPGAWADPSRLPQVLLRGRDRGLPVAATGHLLTILAMTKPGDAHPGVGVVRGLCDPGSLAEFAWAVFQMWRLHGAPARDGWALTALGPLGDDETVRRLAPMIRAWPGQGGHAAAVAGLDVLASIGTDVALMHLSGIARKVRFKGLKSRAQERIDEIAAELELTAEQLADRVAPDFGLDADGSLLLDYGPRRFVVVFDERLEPSVADEDGKPRKSLPKPGPRDDQELAPAAYKRFAALKKDVRTVASDQVHRLESAMVERRRWTPAEFRDLLVAHPLVGHVVRRLVWTGEHGTGRTAFRVAEDRTLAGLDDTVLSLPAGASVGVAHPLDLGGPQVAAWSEVFADYEIVQPFPQLARPVHALTEEEGRGGRLRRFEGLTAPTGGVLGLEGRGWRREDPRDAGMQCALTRPLPDGLRAEISVEPGFIVGDLDLSEVQTVHRVEIHGPDGLAALHPVTASELLADLTALVEPPA